ncbi:glycosyltransferase [Citreimonas sp.]|uniref:glycosyltransferase n=1 Tax=Citreimonas sp. TaxID=3036715 RepID=UPI0035C7F264
MRERAITVQLGARRQYAVPAALASADRLEALYTDLCAGRGIGRLSTLIGRVPPLARRLNLERRRPPADVLARTRVFPRWFVDMQKALRNAKDPGDRTRRLRAAQEAAARRMIRAGYGDATHVVSMFGEAVGYLAEAKKRGLVTVTDMNIAPSTEAIVREEQARHPDWEAPKIFYGQSSAAEAGVAPAMDAVLAATDIFLCPSDFVRQDLVQNFAVSPDRVRLMPYAVNPKWFALTPAPVRGRILFAGGAELRKGIHVLAEAARLLAEAGADVEVQVAGSVPDAIRTRAETRHLSFLDRLDAARMAQAFASADVFVLPSLAEGSAGVTYEALGSGVPVVTTFEAGSIVRDGQDGRIVPARDAPALADALQQLVEDRAMRDAMAASAREHARAHSWAAFATRLETAIFGREGQP